MPCIDMQNTNMDIHYCITHHTYKLKSMSFKNTTTLYGTNAMNWSFAFKYSIALDITYSVSCPTREDYVVYKFIFKQ